MTYYTNIFLNGKNIQINELQVKQYIIIQKALFDAEENFKTFIGNITLVLEEITSLSAEDLLQLDYINFCLLLLHIRCISLGGSIDAHLNDEKNTGLLINLSAIIDYITKVVETIPKITITEKNINIPLTVPTLKTIINSNEHEDTIKNYLYFLPVENIKSEQIISLIYNLPANIFININQKIQDFNTFISKINLLGYLPNPPVNLPLTYKPENITYIIRLLFGTNLITMYENIFALSKYANIPPSYINECTPGEYLILLNLLRAINSGQKQNNNQTHTSNFEDVDNTDIIE